jgi:hypothetical protein
MVGPIGRLQKIMQFATLGTEHDNSIISIGNRGHSTSGVKGVAVEQLHCRRVPSLRRCRAQPSGAMSGCMLWATSHVDVWHVWPIVLQSNIATVGIMQFTP